LRTALQVFSPVIKPPKKAGEGQIRAIARTLGALRDLDVQIADIETDYVRQIKRKSEKKALKRTLTGMALR
jgi:CHAD domain-containing protein